MGQRGKEGGVIMEESGVLGESETPSGDLGSVAPGPLPQTASTGRLH